jgi:hypothetical protein
MDTKTLNVFEMKAMLIFLAGVTLNASAQTNFYAVLVCKNASYTNASIIRTNPPYVIVDYTNGAARVAITNLPQSIQDSIGYDPATARPTPVAGQQRQQDTNMPPPPLLPPLIPIGN